MLSLLTPQTIAEGPPFGMAKIRTELAEYFLLNQSFTEGVITNANAGTLLRQMMDTPKSSSLLNSRLNYMHVNG